MGGGSGALRTPERLVELAKSLGPRQADIAQQTIVHGGKPAPHAGAFLPGGDTLAEATQRPGKRRAWRPGCERQCQSVSV